MAKSIHRKKHKKKNLKKFRHNSELEPFAVFPLSLRAWEGFSSTAKSVAKRV